MDSFDYIQAAKGQALMTCTPEDRAESIRAAVDRAFNLKGMTIPSGVDYETIITEVEKKVANAYPYMTSQELAWITERGVAGELTRDTKPTASAIFGWMYAYMNDDLRKEAIRNYRRNNLGDPSATEPTRAEKDEMNRQAEIRALRTLWAEYKANGRILDDHVPGFVAMAMDRAEKMRLFAIRPEHWKLAKEKGAELCRKRTGLGGLGAALPYEPVFHVKWAMLEMCFSGQKQTGRDLVVNS